MKIKSLVIAVAIAGTSVSAFAQKSAVNTAKNKYEEYATLKGVSTATALATASIKAAKEAVDKAVVHEKTSADPTAWTYKALIYADLALADTTFASDNLASEAASAIEKAVSLDQSGEQKANLQKANTSLAYYERGKGLKQFNAKNWDSAYTAFKAGLKYLPKDSIIGYYAGASALNAKKYKLAAEELSAIKDQKYSFLTDVYINLAESYIAAGDTANAFKILTEATTKFPSNLDFPRREIELSINSGRYKEAIAKITAQAEKEPGNKLYPFYLGIAYGAAKDSKKAEESYLKAVSIDPSFGDAYLNLGSVIMTSGIDTYNAANKLPVNKVNEYNAMKKKALAEIDRALPYLEKAVSTNPQSTLALENLRAYYSIKNNTAKVAEINAKIKALQ